MVFASCVCFLAIAAVQAASQYQDQYSYGRNRAYNQFPSMRLPTLNLPRLQQATLFSPDDLIRNRFGSGAGFNGIAVSSSSSAKTDSFGNVKRNGGTTVITNDNGRVKQYSYGGPDNTENIVIAGFDEPRIPQGIPRTPSRPVNRNYQPGGNEEFRGRSVVSYHHESNINGDRTGGGYATVVENNNGRVNKKTYKYGDLDDY